MTLTNQIKDLLWKKPPKEIAHELWCSIGSVYYVKQKLFTKIKESPVFREPPINWKCSCWYWTDTYFVSCQICKKQNHLDGKWNHFKLQ